MRHSTRGQVDPFIVMDVMEAAQKAEAAGRHIIHMEVGQPGTPAPAGARRALARALEQPLGYTVALGMPRLRIDLRFSEADAASVLGAHDALGAWLARNDLARIEHHHGDPETRAAAVLAGARDGTHQVGTLRMGTDAGSAVVDRDCRSFDLGNLHVVGTGVLPTSGQANPTLTAVQLGLRLAKALAPK